MSQITTRSFSFLIALLVAAPVFAQAPDSILSVKDGSDNVRLRLSVDGGLLVDGVYIGVGGNIPDEGVGTRLMWYPGKSAFRVGTTQGGNFRYEDGINIVQTTGTEWDDGNTGLYSVAMGLDTRALGDYSFAAGIGAYADGTSTVAMGEGTTASGAASVALGYHAHTNARQGSFVFGDRSTTDVVRAGVNHSANWRVSGGFRIFTSSNLSTGLTIQSGASVSNWGQSNAVISTSTGAYLGTNGIWTNTSDVNRKHRFEPISGEDVLERLRTLPIQRWSYRIEDSTRHMGPTAQDFKAAFGLGDDEKAIGTVDADGVALAAAQALEVRTREQAAAIEALRAENDALRVRLDALEAGPRPFAAGVPLAVLVLALGGAAGFVVRRRKA